MFEILFGKSVTAYYSYGKIQECIDGIFTGLIREGNIVFIEISDEERTSSNLIRLENIDYITVYN